MSETRLPRLVARITRLWWVVIAAWALVTAGLLAVAPPFEEVAVYDDTAFLPEGADAIAGNRLVETGWPDDDLSNTITVVLERPDGQLSDDDLQVLAEVAEWARSDRAPGALGPVTTHLEEPDLEATFLAPERGASFLLIGLEVPAYTPRANDAVTAVRDHVHGRELPTGLDAYVTGAAAIAADENVAIRTTVARTTWLSLLLVGAILLWVYRSPVAPLVPLATVGVAFVVSRAVVSLLAQAGMDVSSMFETFAIVIVFGAGTDYCLFLISRYHEELRAARAGALTTTVVVMVAVLGSSAATTMVGFSAQGVAQFGLYRTMGPALAVAIAVTAVTALTLAPALLRMLGPWTFWPERWASRLSTGAAPADAEAAEPSARAAASSDERAPAGVARSTAGERP